MNIPKRPAALLIVAQVICLLAVPLTLQFIPLPSVPNLVVMQNLHLADGTVWLSVLRDFALGGLLIWVEIEAFCVCGRVRKASAFSVKNAKALGRIALALCLAGLLTLLLGDSVVPLLMTGLAVPPVVERLLLPFVLLTLAGMLRAVQLLMRRALDMQDENTLTV